MDNTEAINLGIDKREAKRKAAKFTMRYKVTAPQEFPQAIATTLDVSSKSVAFESPNLFPLRAKIEAEFIVPSLTNTIKVKGIINRTQILEENKYLYSLLYEEITQEDKFALVRYTQSVDIDAILRQAVAKKASDVHLVANQPVMLRIAGDLTPEGNLALNPEDVKQMVFTMMTEEQQKTFERDRELDFSYLIPEARLRVNAHFEKGNVEAALRIISPEIRTISELGLPAIVEELARKKAGLILVTGPAGSGKTTTLAAVIDVINKERSCMIISVEDPIEYIFKSRKSIVKQREVGVDTLSFASALRHVLRQDPNVILVGEMRDLDSISIAMTAAETGHLLLATLHTPNAVEAVNRIVDVYPAEQQVQVRTQLADCVQGIVAQLLLPRSDGKGKIIATEVLIATPSIRNLIRIGKPQEVYSYIETGSQYGMHTMDSSLLKLFNQGLISKETALGYARAPKAMGAKLA